MTVLRIEGVPSPFIEETKGCIHIRWPKMFGFEGKRFIFYFWLVGWDCISLGLHVCVRAPNIEIHLPFGFVRFGLDTIPNDKRRFALGRKQWIFS